MAKRTEKIRLSHAEKQQLKALMARRQQQERKGPRTAQATIPYQRMWPDGICRVTDQYYTKTIRFQDINYQLAQNDDKTAIFEGWCDFLNYFDNSIHLQFSFLNLTASKEVFEQSILIPDREDGNDEIRHEYADMLQTQQAKGNNGLTKTKFITFGIEAEGIKAAKPRLERIEIDLLNNFKRLGVAATPLDGRERLKLMHDMFHMDTQAPFLFDWKWLAPSGLSTKDFIAPSSFDFRDKRTFGMGKKQAEVSFFSILASDLNDRCLADFLAMESSLVVSLHIRAIDQIAAIRDVKRKITDLDKMKIEEQKKAVRAGYDMDIIPSDLATYGGEAKKLLEDLQSRNERMFLITFLVMNTADDKKQLALNVKQAQSLAQQHNCQLIPLDFQQENGMVSCLPLGHNLVRIHRGLTTSSTAIFVPFTSQELFQTGGEALYCGLNALSHNLIMVDRKKLKNPNGLILGTPGSGKSFSAKREIANAFLVTDDDIIINDPEGEYSPLVNRLKGQVITVKDSIEAVNVMIEAGDDDTLVSTDNPLPGSISDKISLGDEMDASVMDIVTNAKIILEKGSNIKAGGSVVMKAVSSQKNNLVPFVEGANIINVKIGNAVISILGNIEAGGAVEATASSTVNVAASNETLAKYYIPLAAGIWYPIFGWKLNPMFGAAAMSLSSFCVVTNALRLNWFKMYDASTDKKIKSKVKEIEEEKTMTKTMKIEGMMCPHCEATVKKILEAIDGVESAEVSHEKGSAVLTMSKNVEDSVLKKAVEDAGYTVK